MMKMPIILPVQVYPYQITHGQNIQVVYPQVRYPHDRQFEHVMNQTFVHETQKLINEQMSEMPTTVETMLGYYEIKNNQRDVLSIALSNYTYHNKAAHGMTFIRSFTFDLEDKKLVQLGDLFKPGSNYVKRLSDIIKRQIKSRDIPVINEFTEINANQEFYLADRSLVIYFQLYDLAPYAFGFPFFPISVYEIQDIIREDGPLGRLAQNN